MFFVRPRHFQAVNMSSRIFKSYMREKQETASKLRSHDSSHEPVKAKNPVSLRTIGSGTSSRFTDTSNTCTTSSDPSCKLSTRDCLLAPGTEELRKFEGRRSASQNRPPLSRNSTEDSGKMGMCGLKQGAGNKEPERSGFPTHPGIDAKGSSVIRTPNSLSGASVHCRQPLPGNSVRRVPEFSVATADDERSSGGRRSRASEAGGESRRRSASQGLRNLGNTCYMNSVLQCLAKLPWMEDDTIPKFNDALLKEFFSLMQQMKRNESIHALDPSQFRKQISALGFRFSTSQQNDAHEFLLCLLNHLNKSLDSESYLGKNPVKELLYGHQWNVIHFKECNCDLVHTPPFFTISLSTSVSGSMSRSVDLRKCLEDYMKMEDLEGGALCLKCQQDQPCSIQTKFKHLPKYLILHMKKYDFENARKLQVPVSFPLQNLKITECTETASTPDNLASYDLFAVCNHYGMLRFGHYTADIKSLSGNWYNYSDSRVTDSSLNFKRSSEVSSDEAYILFYERSNSKETIF